MFVYFIVFIVAFIYHIKAKGELRKNNVILGLIFAYFAIFIGLGDMIGGYDRYVYGETFDTIADEMREHRVFTDLLYLVNGSEYGYFLWEMLISLITRNRYLFIFITSIMMYVLYYRVFRLYIKDYPLAIIIFLGLFFYFTITYLRQVIAVGIVWQGLKYLWERKPIYYFGLVLIAASFHNSALVALALYFLPLKKHTPNQLITFLVISLLLGLTPLPNTIISMTGDAMDMKERTNTYAGEEMVGFRFDYLLEVVVFMWIILKNYSKIGVDKLSLTSLNTSICFCAVLLFFVRFGQGGRFGWYFFIGLIYIFSELASHKKTSKDLRQMIITIFFILFTRITFGWAFNLTPYTTFLTPGYPSGERYIYDIWEYDTNYTNDKFYR